MAQGGDLFSLNTEAAGEPTFDQALRGYDRRQVDKYVKAIEAEVAALATEREEAYAQVQALALQVQRLQAELIDIRHRTGVSADAVSFRHLGPRVEQILALAEEQAEQIKAGALQDIADQRAEASRLLTGAHEQAAAAMS